MAGSFLAPLRRVFSRQAQPWKPIELRGDDGSVDVFSFGDDEGVLDRRSIWSELQVSRAQAGNWYEPPISFVGLGETFAMSPHHQSAIILKKQMLESLFIETPYLSLDDFGAWAQDFMIFGNGWLMESHAMSGRFLRAERLPAAWTRVGAVPGEAWYMAPGVMAAEYPRLLAGESFLLKQPAPLQEIYGVPGYLGALQSGLLNEAATIFRRRYYKNGSHAGYIMYVSSTVAQTDADAMRQAMRESKGRGNFRNMFVHAPNGAKDGVQIIPLSEAAAKDEFLSIKEITRDDVMAAHRVPPQLLGAVPKNGAVFGSISEAIWMMWVMEIQPIARKMLAVNQWAGAEVIRFGDADKVFAQFSAAVAAGAGKV